MFCLNAEVNTTDCKQMIQYTRYTGAALLLFKYNPKIMAHVITYIWVKCNTDLLLELTSSFFRYSSNTNTNTHTHEVAYEPRKPIISKIPVN